MVRLHTILSLTLLSSAAFSTMTVSKAQRELETMVDLVKRELLKTDEFRIFGGDFVIVPQIELNTDDDSANPNANLSPMGDIEFGVMVNQSLLEIEDDIAILFALAHELGHGFSAALLEQINCSQVGGSATEVIADLGAVRLLQAKGLSLAVIDKSISQWEFSNIFNPEVSGDHPAGAERYRFVAMAIQQLEQGKKFINVVNHIIRNELAADCPKN